MGDMSEYRGLIVIGSFITLLIAMIALIPAGFLVASEETPAVQFESGFDSRSIIAWNSTEELAQSDMSVSYGNYYLDWGKDVFGHNMRWIITGADNIKNQHGYTFLGFWTGGHNQEWFTEDGISRGEELSPTEADTDFDTNINASSYVVRCEHFYFDALLTYNTSLYTDFEDAIDNTGLYMVCGITWDQQGTSHDAWSIISGVLLFDLPGTLADNIWVYALVSVPLWLAGIYMTFIFVLRVVGAIFGGGGA